MKKRVLITGGAGFIGSYLCESQLHKGNEVLCCDNFFTGSKVNIKRLFTNNNFELIRHDITFPLYVEIDEIYNLACPASPIHYQKDPVQTVKTNINGLINMLGLAKRTGAKLFQASTSEVYGEPEQHPQTESYWGNVNQLGPRACYDEGKRCAETLCSAYKKQYNLSIKIGRIFNTYGPNMSLNDGRVVSNFIIQALQNEDITIYGDGTQTRSFCFVIDTIRCIEKIMDYGDFGPYNIGNPNEISIIELAEKIISITKSNSKIKYVSLPENDPKIRRPNINKVSVALNWIPWVNLNDGLETTISYFERCLREG